MTEFVEFGFTSVQRPLVWLFDATAPNVSRAYRVSHLYASRDNVTFALTGELDGHSVLIQGAYKDNPRGIVEEDWVTIEELTSPGVVKIEERAFWMRVALTDANGAIVPPNPGGPVRLDPINASTTTENASTTLYNAANSGIVLFLDTTTGTITTTPPPNTSGILSATVYMN